MFKNSTMAIPKLYDIKDAADLLGLSHSATYELVDRNLIEHVRIASSKRRIKITETAIIDYLARNTRPAIEPTESQSEPKPTRRKVPAHSLTHIKLHNVG